MDIVGYTKIILLFIQTRGNLGLGIDFYKNK